MPNPPIHLSRVTLAAHLVFTGYGHWLPNDLRGSGSEQILKEDFKSLGEIHQGRKRIQPKRDELREFHEEAEPLLEHSVIWFDENMRQIIANAFARVIERNHYTCWAFAILRDHAHALIRAHKHHSDEMWRNFALESSTSLRAIATIPNTHPIWSTRPFKVLLFTKHDVITRVPYIEGNPKKHRLAPQRWDFVTRCPWL